MISACFFDRESVMMVDKSLLNIHYLKYLDAVWTDLVTYLPAG